jgi:hypothetical protein
VFWPLKDTYAAANAISGLMRLAHDLDCARLDEADPFGPPWSSRTRCAVFDAARMLADRLADSAVTLSRGFDMNVEQHEFPPRPDEGIDAPQ